MVCQQCGVREAAVVIQTLSYNQIKKTALCSACAGQLQAALLPDLLSQALASLSGRPRAHPVRCGTCRISFANFKEKGRFGCPNCYEHFLAQVKDLLPRIHAGAYQHRGKTPGRR